MIKYEEHQLVAVKTFQGWCIATVLTAEPYDLENWYICVILCPTHRTVNGMYAKSDIMEPV